MHTVYSRRMRHDKGNPAKNNKVKKSVDDLWSLPQITEQTHTFLPQVHPFVHDRRRAGGVGVGVRDGSPITDMTSGGH